MHSLYSQPNLLEATTCKRFKGCYQLESMKVKITDTGCPIRVATIKDVQDQNSLELRLLGNQFLAINHFVGDYLQLKAAVQRFRNGYFYYLAWYEPIIESLTRKKASDRNTAIQKTKHERCLQVIQFLPSLPEQSFCLNVINKLGHNISSYALQKLCKQLSNLTDNQFIVELVSQAEKQNDDISSIGKLLHQMQNKTPYQI
jgi:hypothetical protein